MEQATLSQLVLLVLHDFRASDQEIHSKRLTDSYSPRTVMIMYHAL